MNVLVAVPMRPDEHPFFLACIDKYREALPAHNTGFKFDFAVDDRPAEGSRLQVISAVRNRILDEHLTTDHDLVLMMDSDVVGLPFALPSILFDANPDGITAPEVLIEGTDLFYDTAGFLEHGGTRCRREYPYFDSEDDLVSLDCVGTIYLAPAEFFHGHRYAADPVGLTDHEELCSAARGLGMTVACMAGVEAYHAALPLYGTAWR